MPVTYIYAMRLAMQHANTRHADSVAITPRRAINGVKPKPVAITLSEYTRALSNDPDYNMRYKLIGIAHYHTGTDPMRDDAPASFGPHTAHWIASHVSDSARYLIDRLQDVPASEALSDARDSVSMELMRMDDDGACCYVRYTASEPTGYGGYTD